MRRLHCKLVSTRRTRDRKENGSSRVKGIFIILVEESLKIQRIQLVNGPRATATKLWSRQSRGEKKRFDKSNKQCFKCQRFDRFARECNENKKELQGDEAKFARQEFYEENTLLVMITKRECSNSKLWNNNNNNSRNSTKLSYNRLNDTLNRLHAEENPMMSMKGV